jgi:enoyl-CoA hydratase/carnithine racemase
MTEVESRVTDDVMRTASNAAVTYTVVGAVAWVMLNRPDRLNAINRDVLRGLAMAVDEVERDLNVKVLVIHGAGRAFSAGGDLDEVSGLVQDQRDGFVLAGGFELVQVCDFAVVGSSTTIGDQHANFGLFPAGGSTQRLPRLVPKRVAAWLLMSGEAIAPARALELGLVNVVAPEESVLDEASAMADVLASRSRAASAAIKRAMAVGQAQDIDAATAAERQIALDHMASETVQTGLQAFRTHATPRFDGGL